VVAFFLTHPLRVCDAGNPPPFRLIFYFSDFPTMAAAASSASTAAASSSSSSSRKGDAAVPAASALSEQTLLRQLRTQLLSSVPSRRAFVCSGHLPLVPVLSIDRLGDPLNPPPPNCEREAGVSDE
jgi:hypothetical protein